MEETMLLKIVRVARADHLYAVVDDPSNGDVLCLGRLDDVRAYIRENGYGCVFQRLRVFTLH
jgi:hypothetical protein